MSVHDADHALCLLGKLLIVRDQNNRCAAFMQFMEQSHDVVSGFRVEVSRRLVGKQNGRIGCEGSCNGNTLLLSAGQFGRLVFGAGRKADALQRSL